MANRTYVRPMVVEKSLHAGNIVVVFGVVADVAFSGGIATAIGAALSAHALFKKSDKPTKAMALAIANASEAALSDAGLSGDVKLHVVQMLGAFPPNETDLAKGNLVAETIATRMRDRIEREAKDPSYKRTGELIGYERVLTDVLAAVLAQIDPMQLATWRELLERTEASGNALRLSDEGITEKAIIRLAQRIAGETNDVAQAWLDLQNAMGLAVQVQQDGRVTSNHEGFVDEVLKRVSALTADGEYKAAIAEIEEALEAADAQTLRLLGRAANVALLDGDTSKAASLLIRAADLDAGGQADFAALRALRRGYYETGRDKGLNSEAQLAVDLAELTILRASTGDERGAALNDMGTALSTLGERESGTARLEQAVSAHEAALEEWTQDRVPLDWAMTQCNLASVEIAFFDKDGRHGHLDRAAGHAGKARAVFLESGASHYVAMIDSIAAQIEARRGSA